MLTMKDTGLVGGVELAKTPPTAIKVLRGFFDENGKAVKPGEIIQCSERFARSVIAVNKAERVQAPPAPVAVVSVEPTETHTEPESPEPAQEEHKPSRRGRRVTNED